MSIGLLTWECCIKSKWNFMSDWKSQSAWMYFDVVCLIMKDQFQRLCCKKSLWLPINTSFYVDGFVFIMMYNKLYLIADNLPPTFLNNFPNIHILAIRSVTSHFHWWMFSNYQSTVESLICNVFVLYILSNPINIIYWNGIKAIKC